MTNISNYISYIEKFLFITFILFIIDIVIGVIVKSKSDNDTDEDKVTNSNNKNEIISVITRVGYFLFGLFAFFLLIWMYLVKKENATITKKVKPVNYLSSDSSSIQ